MKTPLFVFALVLSLSFAACTPGDPEVLSPAERGLKVSSDAILLPKVVQTSGGVLIEGRHAQAIQVIKKSLEIVAANSSSNQDGCAKIELLSQEASLKTYLVEYQNCETSFDEKKFSFNGKAQLKITRNDAQGIQTISYATPKISEKSPDTLIYKFVDERVVTIQDEIEIVMEQTSSGVFSVQKLSSQTLLEAESNPPTKVTLAMETTSGAYTFFETGEVLSEFQSKLAGEGLTDKGKLSDFRLDLEKKADSSTASYSVTFNNDKKPGKTKKGTFSFSDEAFTNTEDGKPADTKPRPKNSEKLDGSLPWMFWL